MKILLRKMAAFFGSGGAAGPENRVRRSRSSTSKPGRSASTRSSGGSSRDHGSSNGSVKSSSKVLVRLKSWFQRTKLAPQGHFNVDVGKEKIRYVIPIAYLSHKDLQKLLDDSVEEFGHSYTGVLQLACEEEEFKEVLHTIRLCDEGDQGEDDGQRLIAEKST